MRVCPSHIREAIQRYDSALDIRWVEQDPETGELITRWEIRRRGNDGQMHHVTFWQQIVRVEGKGLFSASKELNENEILEWLHHRDSRRFGSLREFMNHLGMKEDEHDPFKEAHEMLAEKRYSEAIGDLADRIAFLRNKYPHLFEVGTNTKEEQMRQEEIMENREAVQDRIDRRVGKVALNERGVPVVVE